MNKEYDAIFTLFSGGEVEILNWQQSFKKKKEK